jgi:hypothetical protein
MTLWNDIPGNQGWAIRFDATLHLASRQIRVYRLVDATATPNVGNGGPQVLRHHLSGCAVIWADNLGVNPWHVVVTFFKNYGGWTYWSSGDAILPPQIFQNGGRFTGPLSVPAPKPAYPPNAYINANGTVSPL